jgi:hypothetical protein
LLLLLEKGRRMLPVPFFPMLNSLECVTPFLGSHHPGLIPQVILPLTSSSSSFFRQRKARCPLLFEKGKEHGALLPCPRVSAYALLFYI